MESLLSIIEDNNIDLDFTDLPKNESASFLYKGKCYIAIDRNLSGNDLRVHEAHELGHCITGAFYNMYSPYDVRGKHERHADEWAITQLVPEHDYLAAVKGGVRTVAEFAEEFSITEQFARKVIAYYRSKLSSDGSDDEVY